MTIAAIKQIKSAVALAKTTAAASAKTEKAAQTAAAAWGGGAGKASAMKLTHAAIDDGVAVLDKVAVPKGYKAKVTAVEETLTDTFGGKKITIEQSYQRLQVTGHGRTVTVSDPKVEPLSKEWRLAIVEEKTNPSGYAQLDWSSSGSVRGVGTQGRFFSVLESGESYTGGAHPNHGSRLVTYDARTGKQAKLDSLLSQKQMAEVTSTITKKLNAMAEADGTAESFKMINAQLLRDTINSNFALVAGPRGKSQLVVSWESGVHALGGLTANFVFDAPTDAAFLKKLAAVK